MEIGQARAFLAVAGEGSFSSAARRLYRTQPAVTMAVQKLERELGAKLFERSGRGVRITRAGQILRERIGPLLEQWEGARTLLRDSADPVPRGTVRVGADEAAALYLLPGALRSFLKYYPGVQPVVRCQPLPETLEDLRAGEIDFGVAALSAAPPDLLCRPFLRSGRLLLASRGYSDLTRGKITLPKLSRCPILLPPKNSPLRRRIDRAFRAQRLDYRTALEASSWETLKQYAGLGLGIAIVPGFCLPRGDRRLTVSPVSSLFGHDEYGILRRRSGPLSAAAELLLQKIAPASPAA